jgi:hypothetical protein
VSDRSDDDVVPPGTGDLAAFSAALLDALHHRGATGCGDPSAALTARAPVDLVAWVQTWDPDLVDLAAELVQAWSAVDPDRSLRDL